MAFVFDPFSVLGAVLAAASLLRDKGAGKGTDGDVVEVFRKLDPVIEMVRLAKNTHNEFHPIKDTMLSGFITQARDARSPNSLREAWETLSQHLHSTLNTLLDDLPWSSPANGNAESAESILDGVPGSRETKKCARNAGRNCWTLGSKLEEMDQYVNQLDDAISGPDLPPNFLHTVEKLRSGANTILGCCDALIKNSVVVLVEVYDASIAVLPAES